MKLSFLKTLICVSLSALKVPTAEDLVMQNSSDLMENALIMLNPSMTLQILTISMMT